ncbi:flagellar biosynthesis regulator FlaF [Methylocystis parvus]|uniref:Flagellar biosynthesis regulator FlaF n=1 Tax=Methylocystis parvus TaxID=134 RepID=A0A6B8M6N4_9HYPH|nr:flagellar biosynthesis regulator FlaF [Methylocystis parvus]QGM98005.1 flagellar biosynthesis regulator FlaF [Methylocystis parvus]WBK01679.1 flagellar biosynthesis regulator FlaF [Methylocystis parvus OBBP]
MYQQRYAEIASDSARSAREKEREALQAAIARLNLAKARGPRSPEAFEATAFVRRLWTIFLADLGNDDNGLPPELRASLISIGIWMRRETDLIDRGESENFDGLIDINQIIADGLT